MLALHINPYQDSYPSKQKVYIFAFTYPKKRVSFAEIWDTKVMNVVIYKISKKKPKP